MLCSVRILLSDFWSAGIISQLWFLKLQEIIILASDLVVTVTERSKRKQVGTD